jgi:hypothetical protein
MGNVKLHPDRHPPYSIPRRIIGFLVVAASLSLLTIVVIRLLLPSVTRYDWLVFWFAVVAVASYGLGYLDGQRSEQQNQASRQRWKAEDDARRAREEADKIDPHILNVEIIRPPKPR